MKDSHFVMHLRQRSVLLAAMFVAPLVQGVNDDWQFVVVFLQGSYDWLTFCGAFSRGLTFVSIYL